MPDNAGLLLPRINIEIILPSHIGVAIGFKYRPRIKLSGIQ